MRAHQVMSAMDDPYTRAMVGLGSGVNLFGAVVSTELIGLILHLVAAALAPVLIAFAGAFAKNWVETRSTQAAKLAAERAAREAAERELARMKATNKRT